MGEEKKRVLVLVNNCFSKSTSNGRTLGNMFLGYPKELLAQFTTQMEDPDFDLCDRYFYVSDGDALRALTKGERVGRRLSGEMVETQKENSCQERRKTARNALTMLLREAVWNSGRWKRGGFRDFVEEFQPQVLVLQAGDCAFMFRLARKLAKKYQIPYVIFNTEGYYFNKNDYFRGKGLAHWVYPIFRRHFVREFRKTMKSAAHTVYHCETLQEDYSKAFDHPSTVIYAATELQPKAPREKKEGFSAVYMGNLGLMRQEPLIEIGQTLHEISPDCFLDVYGKAPNEEVRQSLERCPGIRCRGYVGYDQVSRLLTESDLVVHGENFAPFYRKYLRHGFSTKIPDTLASGTDFLLYAPEEIACCQYLKKNQAAYVATNREELEEILRELVTNPQSRGRYRENARRLVEQNHRPQVCSKKFQEILLRVK